MKTRTFFTTLLSIILASCSSAVVTLTPTATHIPTATFTVEPSQTPTATPIPTITPTPIHPVSEIVRHEPNEESGYVWFSFVPRTIQKGEKAFILINGASGQISCNDEEAEQQTRKEIEYDSRDAINHSYILLFPVIPQECNLEDKYSLHFPKYTFTAEPNLRYHRPDLRVSAMIDELVSILEKDGYTVDSNVFVFGYSVGGHFANRYALLQPSRVIAFAAGGLSGEITLPLETIGGIQLRWPFGISDYEILTGNGFQLEQYLSIPQFYFWGSEDKFPYHLQGKCNAFGGSSCLQNPYFGQDSADALRKQCSQMQKLNPDIVCKEYLGVGHKFNNAMYTDMYNFFERYR